MHNGDMSFLEAQSIEVRGVLFDMDGVLISSTAADERSWIRWAELHGMQDSFSVRSAHGRRTADTIRALRPDLDLATELSRMEDFDEEDTDGLMVYPGVQDLLAQLSPTQWSVVTSASERIMRYRLGILGVPLPLHFVTADHVKAGKPDPEPYRLAAAQLGFRAAECLVIEDAPSGVRAGKGAGCLVLAVASSHKPDELREADWVVQSLEDVELSQGGEGLIGLRFVQCRGEGEGCEFPSR